MRKGSRSMTTGSSGRPPSTESVRDSLLELSLPAVAASVPRARALVADATRAHLTRDCLDIVRQVLTEVMTHAIRRSRVRARVTVSVSLGDAVYVEVSCPKARFVRRTRVSQELGLLVVGALAERWGIENGSRTRAWFAVPRWPDG